MLMTHKNYPYHLVLTWDLKLGSQISSKIQGDKHKI